MIKVTNLGHSIYFNCFTRDIISLISPPILLSGPCPELVAIFLISFHLPYPKEGSLRFRPMVEITGF